MRQARTVVVGLAKVCCVEAGMVWLVQARCVRSRLVTVWQAWRGTVRSGVVRPGRLVRACSGELPLVKVRQAG